MLDMHVMWGWTVFLTLKQIVVREAHVQALDSDKTDWDPLTVASYLQGSVGDNGSPI